MSDTHQELSDLIYNRRQGYSSGEIAQDILDSDWMAELIAAACDRTLIGAIGAVEEVFDELAPYGRPTLDALRKAIANSRNAGEK